ncbi:MAG TPA: hypothetical protein VFM50_10425 [Nocardioidaceae bacterium]|nr:hypothetical protein [Nocardioidaceae bacterium]
MPAEVVEAKMTADHLNARHPHEAATSGPTAPARKHTARGSEAAKRRSKTMSRDR